MDTYPATIAADVVEGPPEPEHDERGPPLASDHADVSYRLTLDLPRCTLDPHGIVQLVGVITNAGGVALSFTTDASAPLRIGARRTFDDGRSPEACDGHAIPSCDPLLPGDAAPFVLRFRVPDWTGAPAVLELALVCADRSWLSDHGHPSTSIILRRQDRARAGKQNTVMSDTTRPADQDVADADVVNDPLPQATLGDSEPVAAPAIPDSLDTYQQVRLGVGKEATLDDLWNCYRLLLNRTADPHGFELFGRLVLDGMPVAALTDMFIESDEFVRRLRTPRDEPPTRALINGLSLYVPPPQTPAERHVIATGEHKPHLLGAMANALAPDQFVLDVGAGVGTFTILAARHVGTGGRVVALEPDPAVLRLLLANVTVSGYGTIDALPFCAADGDGFVTLTRRGAIRTARNVSDADLTSGGAVDVVYARCLDSILPEGQRVDVLKLALDGFDYRAMLGAKDMLSRHRPHLFGEFAPGLLNEFSGIEPIRYLHLLRECGYASFTAITRDAGAVDLGGDIEKLAMMPARLGTAAVDFYAQGPA